jgi:LmbE family N-acetylglucosaminyl deacetylase
MFKRILILSPHTDDAELGCGGSIAKFMREEMKVFLMVFSDGRPIGEPGVLLSEFHKSRDVFGISPINIAVGEFEMRNFERDRQLILDEMIRVRDRYGPDLVFLPSSKDSHQDHATVSREGLRAFKNCSTILGYEEPWNNFLFETSCFIEISVVDLEKKLRALRCYDSQKSRYYFSEEFVRSLALVRGTQIKTKYAETFEVLRWVMR